VAMPPVIYLTSRTAIEARLAAVRAGGRAYFLKPADVSRIADRLDVLLNKRDDGRPKLKIDVPWYGGGMSFGSWVGLTTGARDTRVSALIGVLVNAMIVLMCGPIIDRMAERRARSVARP